MSNRILYLNKNSEFFGSFVPVLTLILCGHNNDAVKTCAVSCLLFVPTSSLRLQAELPMNEVQCWGMKLAIVFGLMTARIPRLQELR